jgi:hypothetical protein
VILDIKKAAFPADLAERLSKLPLARFVARAKRSQADNRYALISGVISDIWTMI